MAGATVVLPSQLRPLRDGRSDFHADDLFSTVEEFVIVVMNLLMREWEQVAPQQLLHLQI